MTVIVNADECQCLSGIRLWSPSSSPSSSGALTTRLDYHLALIARPCSSSHALPLILPAALVRKFSLHRLAFTSSPVLIRKNGTTTG